jgi:hypothetical protein
MTRLLIAGSRASAHGAIPTIPTLIYSAANQFTITDYDSTLTYILTNCTRSGALITPTGATATIAVQYPHGLLPSTARQALTAAHGRVLDGVESTPASAGCGNRSGDTKCCGPGGIMNTNGDTCDSSNGTQGDFCGGACPGDCFGRFNTCYFYHWTDYSASGYSLIGSTWGKVV